MMIVEKRIERQAHADTELELTFEHRRKTRQRARLASGEDVGLFLERGTILRGGDCLEAADGRIVRIVAAAEALMEVTTEDATLLARAAYHLGNRHCPIDIGDRRLRFAADHVLADMLTGLGLEARPVTAPFEPEAGAYAAGHHHHSGEAKHAGIIHDFMARGPGRG
jgi:urease accessory protein